MLGRGRASRCSVFSRVQPCKAVYRNLKFGLRHMQCSTIQSEAGASDNGCFVFCEVPNKTYIKLMGPDSPHFLNGLLTSKFLPSYVKKNLTTISVNEEDSHSTSDVNKIEEFNEKCCNWGIYNDVGYHGPYISRLGQYTSFLNSKGKIVTDLIVYPTPVFTESTITKYSKFNRHPAYLLEIDTILVSKVLKMFESHSLKNKIKYKLLPENNFKTWELMISLPNVPGNCLNPWINNLHFPFTVAKSPEVANNTMEQIVSNMFTFNIKNGDTYNVEALDSFYKNIKGIYLDRRFDLLMEENSSTPQILKIVTSNKITDISQFFNKKVFPFEFVTKKLDHQFFRDYKLLNGVLDSATDIKPESIWPLELNFDYYPNSVSIDKGCYLGQEIMHRLFSTGRLKKRLIPVKLEGYHYLENCGNKDYKDIVVKYNQDTDIEGQEQVYNPFQPSQPASFSQKRQKVAGSLLTFNKENGLALIRTELFDKIFDSSRKNDYEFLITLESESPEHQSKVVKLTPQTPYWLPIWKKENESQK
ncbi:hypothetical protein TPHA_0G00410 [Tetrapisispora phaffii CBS 4417]|uniref:Uncharacterized protein n=1 Tax=Tetrapisispora phaffii (strain ATCC 24235 / CBS 4417 / NBRC 1672 / NRRL Y-8282 / UCD 70-5) TaxID=1071381 RepID=G8BVE9_TETPH|nr:hypothetical protein TPHA_0G00410 [Tetrapisispora phaffii CBS 4417]CCE63877.1 hypothetical protein TPHA_0G00410 [Tetrapisispora phaffii CBS 4417]